MIGKKKGKVTLLTAIFAILSFKYILQKSQHDPVEESQHTQTALSLSVLPEACDFTILGFSFSILKFKGLE